MIGVGAVIMNDIGDILFVKHIPERGGFWQGKWICPGGILEWGESIKEGIHREVREETQLEIKLVKPLVPFERIALTGKQVVLHVIYIDYLAQLIGGTLNVGSDIGEAMWVNKRCLNEIWHELHDDTKKLLKIAELI